MPDDQQLDYHQYSECNPVRYVDPLGLFTIKNKFPDETLPEDGVILPHTIENGKIKEIDGKREMDFVVTQDGRLVISEKHHLLGNAEDVLAAGQQRLNGLRRIRRIDNLSGHYRPTLDESLNFPEALKISILYISGATLIGYRIPVTSDGLALQPILEIKKVLRNE